MPRTTAEPRVTKTFRLSSSVNDKVMLLLMDELRLRTKYGTFSDLVDSLLRKWLQDRGIKL